jgi:hypothetical protein
MNEAGSALIGDRAVRASPRWDVVIYGLHVRSDVELPGWPPASGTEPAVHIIEKPPVPPTFEGNPHTVATAFDGGAAHLEIRGVGRYSVIGGDRIEVAPEPFAKPEDIRLYLTGAMFGLILHQRRTYPLHASCVQLGGGGVAFAAPSGSGKSALVAALMRRGATFVSDDICVLTPRDGRLYVWPSAARVKLDQAGIRALEESASTLEPAGGNRGKFHVPISPDVVVADPVPLERIYLPAFAEGAPRLERLTGLDAVSALVDETKPLAFGCGTGRARSKGWSANAIGGGIARGHRGRRFRMNGRIGHRPNSP